MAMHETVDASFVHDLLDEMGVTSTACGGEGDAEARLNVYERIRQAKRRLAADRAELEERAKPIDAGWLESLGFAPDGVLDLGGDGRLTWRPSHGDVTLWGYPGTACSTRGRLLDLLIALKGGAE